MMTSDIIVKFFFTKKTLVPAGIPMVHRLDTATQDSLHAAKDEDKGNIGRHRQGRVDTGKPVFGRHGLENVSISMLKRALHAIGYSLIDIHFFEKQYKGKPQYVVNLTFKHKSKGASVQLTEEQRTALNYLADFTWGQCHVWDNTKTSNDNYTVNCTCCLADIRIPQRKLSTRNGVFTEVGPDKD